ncbi:MAG TPA: hypothetical protein VK400_19555 [Pyrinomonadaceae bacterium]|nr:hypothetical protein [Pyrinomonadaceae bacterium]
MAEIKNVNRGGEVNNPAQNQINERDAPRVSQTSVKTNQAEFPVGQPTGTQATVDTPNLPPGQKILPDAVTGRDETQLEAARQLTTLGGASATDRLLGLDLRPTMTGALSAPPGNSEFLRHLSPQARRTIMRKMLTKQRERMRRLARFLRERHDESNGGSGNNHGGGDEDRESFLEVISEPRELDRAQITRAAAELDKAARMLDILDEMLTMQDYTISQIGTFSQG